MCEVAREMLEAARQLYTLNPKLSHYSKMVAPNSNKLTLCRLDVFPSAPNLSFKSSLLVGYQHKVLCGWKPKFEWCKSLGRLCLLSVPYPGVLATKVSSQGCITVLTLPSTKQCGMVTRSLLGL